MALLVPNAAEAIILRYLVNTDAPEDLTIHLYTGVTPITETMVVGDFTELPVANGYASIPLTGTWTITEADPSLAEHTLVDWTFTGTVGNVHGYFVTRATGGELMWAEEFTNGPYDIQTASDQIRITPRITAN